MCWSVGLFPVRRLEEIVQRTADTLIGRVLDGRYRIGPRIARGGMATVYEATDLRLDRTVAVKVMHEGLAEDDEFVRRFQREARSAARLSHPNVVAVHDTGDDDGTLFLVMEYVPGRTLRDLLRADAPLSPGRALAVVEPVLSALAAAHDARILHRDVKPENVLIADDGRVKVVDFGLSRAISSETQHTADGGVLIGTVSYLAPELVVDGRADARADVYAAGVVLYELLTGHKPHQADSPIQVAYKHVHEDVPAPSASRPGIPAYVDALVARATSRNPDLRPADARVLLHQVRRVRQALDHGVVSDPDLLADLTPTTPVPRPGDREQRAPVLPRRVIEPEQLVDLVEDDRSDVDPEHWTDEVYDQEAHPPAAQTTQTALADGPRERIVPRRPSEDADAADHPWTRDPAPHRSRRGPALLVLVLVLAVLAAAGGWYFGVARYTSTPGVLALGQDAARTRLEKDGLSMRVRDRGYSETVPRGSVLSTDPGPGDRVVKGGTVGAVISLGPARHRVPALRGRVLDDAQQALDEAHLGYGDAVQRYDEVVPKGRVVTTDPVAGTSLRRNQAVDVIVSRGPRPIKVPDLTGKDADAAKRLLDKRGFEVTTTEDNSDTVPEGRVISQSPDSGTGQKGDEVALVVSKGPVLVTVPDVVGAGLTDATSRLEAAGFEVEVRHASLYIGVKYVVSTDPGRGSKAPRGSTIVVQIV